MTALVAFECEACGLRRDYTPDSTPWHLGCPQRELGKAVPRYVIVTQTAGAHESPSGSGTTDDETSAQARGHDVGTPTR